MSAGENESGNRHFTLGCLDEDGQRYIVNHSDLLGAVCELAVLLGCDLSDVQLLTGSIENVHKQDSTGDEPDGLADGRSHAHAQPG